MWEKPAWIPSWMDAYPNEVVQPVEGNNWYGNLKILDGQCTCVCRGEGSDVWINRCIENTVPDSPVCSECERKGHDARLSKDVATNAVGTTRGKSLGEGAPIFF